MTLEIYSPELLAHVPMPADASELASIKLEPDTPPPITTRVLHIAHGEHFSGAERVQSHLGRCLPRFGVAADFACTQEGKFTRLLQEQQGRWGRVHPTPMGNSFDLRAAWQIRDLVRRDHYDLLHAHTPRTALIASVASRLAGVPWVYHVHSPASRDSDKLLDNRLNAWIERLSLHGCSHLIAVSEHLRLDCVAAGVAEEAVTVVYNGTPQIQSVRQSTPTVGGRWTIGMVALMRARKGLDVVLEALAELQQAGHDVLLRCIGSFESEEYEREIDRHISRKGLGRQVERVGFADDVPAELAKLDALVLPSLFGEGLPMVVLEAMAAGLPVIATRAGGTPEAITDGVEGLLADPCDPGSLGEKIRELITGVHAWQQMADAASARHVKDFSDLAMARGTAAVYRQVLGD